MIAIEFTLKDQTITSIAYRCPAGPVLFVDRHRVGNVSVDDPVARGLAVAVGPAPGFLLRRGGSEGLETGEDNVDIRMRM